MNDEGAEQQTAGGGVKTSPAPDGWKGRSARSRPQTSDAISVLSDPLAISRHLSHKSFHDSTRRGNASQCLLS